MGGPANGMCTMDADGIEGTMLGSEVVNGAYAYDYTIEQKGQPKRHLRTLFAVQTEEGRGLRLITLTAQCYETRYADLAPTFKKVLASYKSSLKRAQGKVRVGAPRKENHAIACVDWSQGLCSANPCYCRIKAAVNWSEKK